MKRITNFLITLIVITSIFSCEPSKKEYLLLVENYSEIDRNNDVVVFELNQLPDYNIASLKEIAVIDNSLHDTILSQLLDIDGDGVYELLLFQAKVEANSAKEYGIVENEQLADTSSKVYSRFIPERTDDYAWENDKVAFRTYGPVAQQLFETGDATGTLSSGIDCWLKKVNYPIINKWYAKHTSGEGSYHADTGEGLDNFHVGSSRGCGGLGVYVDSVLYVSKNFKAYKTLSNGPIRTSFTLDYADWQAGVSTIKEKKLISLDLGDNLTKIKAEIIGSDVIAVGLTLHENDGIVSMDTTNGWFSYWQPHGDSELGTAIVCKPVNYMGYIQINSQEKDKSQLLVFLKVIDGEVNYYTGFSWKESGQYPTKESWEQYLDKFSKCKHSPLVVKVLKD
ncbi:MAG: DUF4861 family protein [Bacteroidales bacterium]|nr:DUF4861 family protein [Bacteroidales bacterium]